MTTKNETHLLSGAYALDAVTPEEAAAFEAAMRDSEELRGETVGLTDTAVALGLAVRPASPPPALRAALLDAIERTPQLPAEEEAPAEPAPVQHLAPRRRRRRLLRRPSVLLAAAAVAVLLFSGGVLVQRALVQPDLQYSAIVAAADSPTVRAVSGGGEATVYSSRSEGGSAIVLKGVSVPAGHVLQVWSVQGGRAVSAGLYETGAHYRVVDHAPAAGESIAVTVEPDGGSARPTTDPIVSVPVRA